MAVTVTGAGAQWGWKWRYNLVVVAENKMRITSLVIAQDGSDKACARLTVMGDDHLVLGSFGVDWIALKRAVGSPDGVGSQPGKCDIYATPVSG